MTAWVDLMSPRRAAARLDELAAQPALRGIRHLIHDEDDPHWILRPKVLESLALLEERRLVLELPCVFPRHLADVPELARRFPDLAIVIDHLGKPPIGTDAMPVWESELRATAESANVVAKISGLNTALDRRDWDAADLRAPVEIAFDCFGPQRLLCGSDWPVALLNGDYARVWSETVRIVDEVARGDAARLLGGNAARLYALSTPASRETGGAWPQLTDQAIAKIKDLIVSGEFAAGAKLPKEQVLAKRLGLSRNSLREAVRALALIGVVEPRVGDGTYVTSLEPELLLAGMGFISDLLTGPTLLELHQVRRVLEPVATGMAATRMTAADLSELEQCLAQMEAAETTRAFIAADEEFHRIIVAASGNATLASLIQNLSGGTLRARLWRSVTEQDAVQTTSSATGTSTARWSRRCRAGRCRRHDSSRRGRVLAQEAHRGGSGSHAPLGLRRFQPQRTGARRCRQRATWETGRSPCSSVSVSRRARARWRSKSPTRASAAPTCTSSTGRWMRASAPGGARSRDVGHVVGARRRRRRLGGRRPRDRHAARLVRRVPGLPRRTSSTSASA